MPRWPLLFGAAFWVFQNSLLGSLLSRNLERPRTSNWNPSRNQLYHHILLVIHASMLTSGRFTNILWTEENPAPVDRWLIPLFLGFQPSVWWCRISQPSTVGDDFFFAKATGCTHQLLHNPPWTNHCVSPSLVPFTNCYITNMKQPWTNHGLTMVHNG